MAATPGLWPTPGCFDDVRVLEIGDEKGEFCGRLLSGQGADVIKIEPPGGSSTRDFGPFYEDVQGPNRSLFFWMYNRGKRGITLDLAKNEGREAYLRLVETAEVVLDTQGIGDMDELGLGYQHVRERNPDIVYCSITPFGLTGPWRDFKASDLIHLALGGSTYCCGYDPVVPGKWDTPPMTPQMWHAYCVGGEHSAIAIAATLLYRQVSGQGQFIDASIHDACAQCTEQTVSRYIYHGIDQSRRLPGQIKCADGLYLNGGGLNRPTNLARVVEVLAEAGMAEDLGDPQLYGDPSYIENREVISHISELVAQWAATKPVMEVFHALQSCRSTCAPVRPPEALIDDPQCIAREDFVEIEHPELGKKFIYPRHPRRQTETPWRWGPRAPLVGEHNDRVYSEILGMPQDEINRYTAMGIF